MACVYRALLRNGDEVAVKVRRPGIRKAFETDLAAMELITQAAEFLTIIRAGLSDSFKSEVRAMLEEELDFPSEARYQELFRRYQRRRKKLNVSAPRVYHDLSGREMIVTEFVRGIWVKDIMARVQADDREYLAYLHGLGIDPRRVAKRLIDPSIFSSTSARSSTAIPIPATSWCSRTARSCSSISAPAACFPSATGT